MKQKQSAQEIQAAVKTLATSHTQIRPSRSVRVCMHVLGVARTDVRVMREATLLAQHQYAVSIVDVESANQQPVEEQFQHVRLKHILVSPSFAATRFTRWPLVRSLQLLIRGTLQLIMTPADIYHAHDVSALPACFIAALLRRKPLVFDSHEVPLEEITIPFRWIYLLFTFLLTYIVPRCAGVITVSAPIVREMQRLYGASQVSLIRNVPAYRVVPQRNTLRQALGIDAATRIVLYQGYLQNGRGLDELIYAAKLLEPQILIVMMGADAEGIIPRLESLIISEGVVERVKIIPPAPYAELLDWTASADLGLIIYPPAYSTNVQMCLPNKFFEYLMAGLPVLASQLDAISEIINTYDVGRVIPSLAPVDIANAINVLITEPELLETMHNNALRAARQEFCWEKEGQELLRLYDGVKHSV